MSSTMAGGIAAVFALGSLSMMSSMSSKYGMFYTDEDYEKAMAERDAKAEYGK